MQSKTAHVLFWFPERTNQKCDHGNDQKKTKTILFDVVMLVFVVVVIKINEEKQCQTETFLHTAILLCCKIALLRYYAALPLKYFVITLLQQQDA